MRMTRRIGPGAVAITIVAALLSACAGSQPGGAMPSEPAAPPSSGQAAPSPVAPADSSPPPLSSTQLPTRNPAKPPKTPTDQVPTDVVLGRVTRGGPGPCYGVVDDDGIEYAVFSTAGVTLAEGKVVRIKYQQLKRAIDCGAGRRVHATKIEILN